MNERLEAFSAELSASPQFAETRLLSLLDFLREPIDDVIDNVGGVEPFIVMVNGLYDQYIAPIDVPWVPNMLEPSVIDAPAKMILAAVIRRLHSRIHTD